MAHLKGIVITKDRICQGGCLCMGVWFCRNCGALLFYHLNGIPKKSVAIGMLDDVVA